MTQPFSLVSRASVSNTLNSTMTIEEKGSFWTSRKMSNDSAFALLSHQIDKPSSRKACSLLSATFLAHEIAVHMIGHEESNDTTTSDYGETDELEY